MYYSWFYERGSRCTELTMVIDIHICVFCSHGFNHSHTKSASVLNMQTFSFLKICFIFLRLFMWMHACMGVYAQNAGATESRKGQIPRNWNDGCLWVTWCGCWGPNSGCLREQHTLYCWASSPTLTDVLLSPLLKLCVKRIELDIVSHQEVT